MTKELKKWHAADYLKDADDIAAYLEVVYEENDPALTIKALEAVARSAGTTELAASRVRVASTPSGPSGNLPRRG